MTARRSARKRRSRFGGFAKTAKFFALGLALMAGGANAAGAVLGTHSATSVALEAPAGSGGNVGLVGLSSDSKLDVAAAGNGAVSRMQYLIKFDQADFNADIGEYDTKVKIEKGVHGILDADESSCAVTAIGAGNADADLVCAQDGNTGIYDCGDLSAKYGTAGGVNIDVTCSNNEAKEGANVKLGTAQFTSKITISTDIDGDSNKEDHVLESSAGDTDLGFSVKYHLDSLPTNGIALSCSQNLGMAEITGAAGDEDLTGDKSTTRSLTGAVSCIDEKYTFPVGEANAYLQGTSASPIAADSLAVKVDLDASLAQKGAIPAAWKADMVTSTGDFDSTKFQTAEGEGVTEGKLEFEFPLAGKTPFNLGIEYASAEYFDGSEQVDIVYTHGNGIAAIDSTEDVAMPNLFPDTKNTWGHTITKCKLKQAYKTAFPKATANLDAKKADGAQTFYAEHCSIDADPAEGYTYPIGADCKIQVSGNVAKAPVAGDYDACEKLSLTDTIGASVVNALSSTPELFSSCGFNDEKALSAFNTKGEWEAHVEDVLNACEMSEPARLREDGTATEVEVSVNFKAAASTDDETFKFRRRPIDATGGALSLSLVAAASGDGKVDATGTSAVVDPIGWTRLQAKDGAAKVSVKCSGFDISGGGGASLQSDADVTIDISILTGATGDCFASLVANAATSNNCASGASCVSTGTTALDSCHTCAPDVQAQTFTQRACFAWSATLSADAEIVNEDGRLAEAKVEGLQQTKNIITAYDGDIPSAATVTNVASSQYIKVGAAAAASQAFTVGYDGATVQLSLPRQGDGAVAFNCHTTAQTVTYTDDALLPQTCPVEGATPFVDLSGTVPYYATHTNAQMEHTLSLADGQTMTAVGETSFEGDNTKVIRKVLIQARTDFGADGTDSYKIKQGDSDPRACVATATAGLHECDVEFTFAGQATLANGVAETLSETFTISTSVHARKGGECPLCNTNSLEKAVGAAGDPTAEYTNSDAASDCGGDPVQATLPIVLAAGSPASLIADDAADANHFVNGYKKTYKLSLGIVGEPNPYTGEIQLFDSQQALVAKKVAHAGAGQADADVTVGDDVGDSTTETAGVTLSSVYKLVMKSDDSQGARTFDIKVAGIGGATDAYYCSVQGYDVGNCPSAGALTTQTVQLDAGGEVNLFIAVDASQACDDILQGTHAFGGSHVAVEVDAQDGNGGPDARIIRIPLICPDYTSEDELVHDLGAGLDTYTSDASNFETITFNARLTGKGIANSNGARQIRFSLAGDGAVQEVDKNLNNVDAAVTLNLEWACAADGASTAEVTYAATADAASFTGGTLNIVCPTNGADLTLWDGAGNAASDYVSAGSQGAIVAEEYVSRPTANTIELKVANIMSGLDGVIPRIRFDGPDDASVTLKVDGQTKTSGQFFDVEQRSPDDQAAATTTLVLELNGCRFAHLRFSVCEAQDVEGVNGQCTGWKEPKNSMRVVCSKRSMDGNSVATATDTLALDYGIQSLVFGIAAQSITLNPTPASSGTLTTEDAWLGTACNDANVPAGCKFTDLSISKTDSAADFLKFLKTCGGSESTVGTNYVVSVSAVREYKRAIDGWEQNLDYCDTTPLSYSMIQTATISAQVTVSGERQYAFEVLVTEMSGVEAGCAVDGETKLRAVMIARKRYDNEVDGGGAAVYSSVDHKADGTEGFINLGSPAEMSISVDDDEITYESSACASSWTNHVLQFDLLATKFGRQYTGSASLTVSLAGAGDSDGADDAAFQLGLAVNALKCRDPDGGDDVFSAGECAAASTVNAEFDLQTGVTITDDDGSAVISDSFPTLEVDGVTEVIEDMDAERQNELKADGVDILGASAGKAKTVVSLKALSLAGKTVTIEWQAERDFSRRRLRQVYSFGADGSSSHVSTSIVVLAPSQESSSSVMSEEEYDDALEQMGVSGRNATSKAVEQAHHDGIVTMWLSISFGVAFAAVVIVLIVRESSRPASAGKLGGSESPGFSERSPLKAAVSTRFTSDYTW